MRTNFTTSLIAAAAAALALTLTACEGDNKVGGDKPQAAQTTKAPAAPATTKAPDADAESGSLTDMTGKGLQSAQDQAQAAGFYNLHSHDALGRGRAQALDRNWKVCGQTPAAGEHPTDVKIDFATVKLEETCPAADQGVDEPQVGSTMPDFTGKSVKVARQSLDTSTSLTVTDASPEGRMVLMESNWQVCTQEPAAGTKLDGQPVALTAVKFEESC
ncbi:PASTA domain-containing protein [Streptomyces exfoliatus]|uniref:PASTA domain-containing protein n=1 Tax=Streptomyces exfoliatus TaxID=1905 RepID=UPI003C2D6669